MDYTSKYKYEKYKCKYLALKYKKPLKPLAGGNIDVVKQFTEHINRNNQLVINQLQQLNTSKKIIPIIEFYEYSVENYVQANQKNRFKGFVSSNSCSVISAEKTNNVDNNNNILCCDVLAASSDDQVDLNKYPLSENYLQEYIRHLYNSYKLYESRSSLIDITSKDDKFCPIYIGKIMKVIKALNTKYFDLTSNINNFIQYRDYSYVQVVDIDPQEKIAVIGDIHGSLHTFVRILFRFHRYGIIDLETFTVRKGYRIIFLGDVVDRGNFSLEIVFTILLLMNNSNTDVKNPRVIYNRGNHEELSINTSQGFFTELLTRCGELNGKTLHNAINGLFKLFPSAIIINVKRDDESYRCWLAYGGFSINYLNNSINMSKHIAILTAEDGKQTRWADFYQYQNDSAKHFIPNVGRGVNKSNYKTDVLILNRKHLAKFLDKNDINFVIRGHQDNYYNSYMFTNKCENANVCGLGIELSDNPQDGVLIYNSKLSAIKVDNTNKVKTNGPIARFVIDKSRFNRASDNGEIYYYKESGEHEIYPVITLSTNTDRDRNLSNDSFAVIRFDLAPSQIGDFDNSTFGPLSDLPENLGTNS